jgi:hypothetical protein
MTLGRHHGGRFDEFVEAGGDAASHRIRDLSAQPGHPQPARKLSDRRASTSGSIAPRQRPLIGM